MAAHIDLDSTTDRICIRCGAVMGERDLACPNCRFSPMTGKYADDQERGAGEQGPQPWMSLMGIDFTTRRLIATMLCLLLLVGAAVWYRTGPGASLKVIDSRIVTTLNAFEGISVHDPGPLEMYVLGSGSEIILSRPVPDGDKVMARVRIRQSLLDDNDRLDRRENRVMLFESDFAVEVDGQRTTPLMLVRRMGGTAEVAIGASSTSDYRRMLPPGAEPSQQELEGMTMSGAATTGTVYFDGAKELTGQINFMAFGLASDMAIGGLTATGQLKRVAPHGYEVVYDYQGGSLNINWREGDEAWRASKQLEHRARMARSTKYEVTLVFNRPTTGGRARIYYRDQHLASVRVRAAPPAPVVADADQQAEEEEVREPTGYLGALARARRRGQGIAAASNMQQIVTALLIYSYEYRGQWPDDLKQLDDRFLPGIEQFLYNERTRENPGFAYVKPSDEDLRTKPDSQVPVLFEVRGGQIDPNGSIGYADGHIEFR